MFLFQLMPSIIPLTYHFLLPSPSSFLASRGTNTPSAYVPLATAEDDAEGVQEEELDVDDNREFGRQPDLRVEEQELMIDDSNGKTDPVSKKVSLSANDKWRLVKPLLARYMLPLCTFQFFYSWNLGFGFWIYLTVFVSGFVFPFQCPAPLQRTKLTNLELILVCVYLVRAPFNLRVCVSDQFAFFWWAYTVRVYNQSGWFFSCFYLYFSSLPILTANLSTMQGISPTLLYPVPTREESWLLSKIIHSVRDYYPLWQVMLLLFLLLFYSTSPTARIPKHRVHVPIIDFCWASCARETLDQSPCVCAGGDFGSVGVGGRGGCVWVVE